MDKELKAEYEYEEVADIIFEIVVETNLQKEGINKDYKITYKDDGNIDLVSILKEKDKIIIVVNGIKGEIKRDGKVPYKLLLKIYEMLKLSEIEKTVRSILSNKTMYLSTGIYDNF